MIYLSFTDIFIAHFFPDLTLSSVIINANLINPMKINVIINNAKNALNPSIHHINPNNNRIGTTILSTKSLLLTESLNILPIVS